MELLSPHSQIKAVWGIEQGTIYKFSPERCNQVSAPLVPLLHPFLTSNPPWAMIYIGFGNSYNNCSFYPLNKQQCKDPNLFLAISAKSSNSHKPSDELDLNAPYRKPS